MELQRTILAGLILISIGCAKPPDSNSSISKLTGHGAPVNCLAFSPDGKLLASGSVAKSIKIWDLATGKEIFTLQGHARPVLSLAFSPDGKTLASACDS